MACWGREQADLDFIRESAAPPARIIDGMLGKRASGFGFYSRECCSASAHHRWHAGEESKRIWILFERVLLRQRASSMACWGREQADLDFIRESAAPPARIIDGMLGK